MMSSRYVLLLFFVATLSLSGNQPKKEAYSSTRIDQLGRLHIVLTSGKEVVPPKIKDQIAFSDSLISPDRETVGWLVDYANPDNLEYKSSPIAGDLILYRGGHVLQRFTADQIFWDWKFVDQGAKVAYSTGPAHGGATECILRDVQSGAVIGRWKVQQSGTAPEWAQSLRY